MSTEEFLASGTLEAYALGTATPQEVALCQQMLQDQAVANEYAAIAAAIEVQAEAFAKEAPAGIWEAISKEISPSIAAPAFSASSSSAPLWSSTPNAANTVSSTPPAPKAPLFFVWRAASYAMAAMLLVSLGVNFYFYGKTTTLSVQLAAAEQEKAVIAQTASFSQEKLAKLETENEHMNGLLTQALMPMKGIIEMKPMVALVAKGHMSVSYDKKTRMVALRGSDMPDMPKGMVVQLWAIVDGKPVSLGLCTDAAEGNMVMAEYPTSMSEPEAFALSMEAGEAQPTPHGPILAMGKVY